VTLTLIPAAIVLVIAGSPSTVAGILMKRFGRSTSHQRCAASAAVASVSWARSGATSSDTRPSRPVAAATGASRSQASRTSAAVMVRSASSTLTPRTAIACSWSS
jgi:hypothetical protein